MSSICLANDQKAFKASFLGAVFTGLLVFGFFACNPVAKGEVICAEEDFSAKCADVVFPSDLESEKRVYEGTVGQPRITWEKNASYLGDFVPDKLFVLEDEKGTFEVTETESISNDDRQVNLLAIGIDQDEINHYSFHMQYPDDGINREADFIKFIADFKN